MLISLLLSASFMYSTWPKAKKKLWRHYATLLQLQMQLQLVEAASLGCNLGHTLGYNLGYNHVALAVQQRAGLSLGATVSRAKMQIRARQLANTFVLRMYLTDTTNKKLTWQSNAFILHIIEMIICVRPSVFCAIVAVGVKELSLSLLLSLPLPLPLLLLLLLALPFQNVNLCSAVR